jgi:nitronate monooxygenase
MLRGRRTKHWMRSWFAVRSAMQLRKASLDPKATQDFWQAGRSVAGVHSVEPVARIVADFAAAALAAASDASDGDAG